MRLKMTVILATMGLLVAAAVLQGCSVNLVDVFTGSTATATGPSPVVSPSPGGGVCDVKRVELGTERDVHKLPPGGSAKLVVSVYGAQAELEGQCLVGLTARFEVQGACRILGSGLRGAEVTVPTGTPPGSVCRLSATVSGPTAAAVTTEEPFDVEVIPS